MNDTTTNPSDDAEVLALAEVRLAQAAEAVRAALSAHPGIKDNNYCSFRCSAAGYPESPFDMTFNLTIWRIGSQSDDIDVTGATIGAVITEALRRLEYLVGQPHRNTLMLEGPEDADNA